MNPESYDRLDFSRPNADLRPHYHSTSTLKSVKSSGNVVGGGGGGTGNKSPNLLPVGKKPDLNASTASDGDYIDTPLTAAANSSFNASLRERDRRRASSGHLSQAELPKVRCVLSGMVFDNQGEIRLGWIRFFKGGPAKFRGGSSATSKNTARRRRNPAPGRSPKRARQRDFERHQYNNCSLE